MMNVLLILAAFVIAVNLATTISTRFRRWIYMKN